MPTDRETWPGDGQAITASTFNLLLRYKRGDDIRQAFLANGCLLCLKLFSLLLGALCGWEEDRNVLEFHVLGPLEVVGDDGAISVGGARQRALLSLLLLRANEVVATERLVDALYGEQPP